ncbi:helix-turn-helix transcriptional regulator [Pseudomonas syringae pv. aptata]|uniref:DNA-binding protein n=9 Tax=Pseudomonas syringae group TaxID=136849 RepID=F3G4V8_PSESJ|nr:MULTISPECIES: helix-turn-helix transcriptional regulator [Pseudomonas]EGH30280.1 DNA-binding protein [Pseudomonas syringae pv. japonica str. M301072]EGH42108.1 DNA-binding protein [Pseudomonas syringae pv. pisi str. 1704B]KEZ72168.1 XRE family transcriptional regulator [Pseudomonas syringae pv. syringae FF5]ALU62609.1 XRE family transcriptional regulator [Pseudomonas syringae pv. lapsa]EKG35321.1 DNA-binding protein [Pseudomonas syringae pv. avellanae str. ISPaVe037]
MKAFFPVQCTDTLLRIALLVKQTRLQQGIRQVDLAERLGISLRTFRRIEAGNAEGVSLRDFMLVVWGLGVSERLFQGLRDDESFSVEQLEAADRKRVRLPRHKPEDF